MRFPNAKERQVRDEFFTDLGCSNYIAVRQRVSTSSVEFWASSPKLFRVVPCCSGLTHEICTRNWLDSVKTIRSRGQEKQNQVAPPSFIQGISRAPTVTHVFAFAKETTDSSSSRFHKILWSTHAAPPLEAKTQDSGHGWRMMEGHAEAALFVHANRFSSKGLAHTNE